MRSEKNGCDAGVLGRSSTKAVNVFVFSGAGTLEADNRIAAAQIAGQAPVLGPYLTRLLGGEGSVGVVTFARFYGMHVLLLPPATILLIGLHVYLVRKHGVAPAPGDEILPKKKFYPSQVFKDTVAIFIAFAVAVVLQAAANRETARPDHATGQRGPLFDRRATPRRLTGVLTPLRC